MDLLELRPEVEAFAQLMEAKLRENDHKSHWSHESGGWLLRRLGQETGELRRRLQAFEQEYRKRTSVEWRAMKGSLGLEVGREAADVANFAMMIADVCGALRTAPK